MPDEQKHLSAEQTIADVQFAQAIRAPQAAIVIDHIEDRLHETIDSIILDEMSEPELLAKAMELQFYGKLLKGMGDRIDNAVTAATKRLVRGHLRVPQ